MIEYKSSFKTVYVNPRGTSSECPVCGDKLRDIEMRNLWRGLRQG
ncbi:MAG: zinc ribbon domain-containing protein [Conexivisphaerales archaeon]